MAQALVSALGGVLLAEDEIVRSRRNTHNVNAQVPSGVTLYYADVNAVLTSADCLDGDVVHREMLPAIGVAGI